jgi:hypothetical protein
MEVEISRLLEHSPVGAGRHLEEDRVRRYSELLDQLPPVTVFALEDRTLLLADGYHRVAAAQRAGRSMIRADVRPGTRAQAIQFAVDIARAERGVSAEQAREAIRRYSGGERKAQPDQPS